MPVLWKHALRRCAISELGVANRLGETDWHLFDNNDLCEQLYMDVLGYGLNGINPTGAR